KVQARSSLTPSRAGLVSLKTPAPHVLAIHWQQLPESVVRADSRPPRLWAKEITTTSVRGLGSPGTSSETARCPCVAVLASPTRERFTIRFRTHAGTRLTTHSTRSPTSWRATSTMWCTVRLPEDSRLFGGHLRPSSMPARVCRLQETSPPGTLPILN